MRLLGCHESNNGGAAMQRRDDGNLLEALASRPLADNFAFPIKMGYDDRSDDNTIESSVIWIGKDSKSETDQYLEECNTHQSGE